MGTNCAVSIRADDPRYPPAVRALLGPAAPAAIEGIGNPALIGRDALALFCSRKCPGKLILRTCDLAQKWRDAGETVIGGFHSPMERECLQILLRSPHPVIVCPARGLPKRFSPDWRRALEEGRLLVLSPFAGAVRRADADSARRRNLVVAALASRIFVAYAAPGSATESFCREIIAWKKPLFTHGDDANRNLLALGAREWGT